MEWYEEPKKQRMNRDLCPDEFKILVPKQCKLLGDLESPAAWERSPRKLNDDDERFPACLGAARRVGDRPCV